MKTSPKECQVNTFYPDEALDNHGAAQMYCRRSPKLQQQCGIPHGLHDNSGVCHVAYGLLSTRIGINFATVTHHVAARGNQRVELQDHQNQPLAVVDRGILTIPAGPHQEQLLSDIKSAASCRRCRQKEYLPLKCRNCHYGG